MRVRNGVTNVAVLSVFAVSSACAGGSTQPASLQAGDTCAFCRMAVSDERFAAQLVAPGEEPLFFDDIGCLASQLQRARSSDEAVAYVADHRTSEWVPASRALYTRVDALATPMGSHLIAHADTPSRERDSAAHGGVNVPASEIFGSALAGGIEREP